MPNYVKQNWQARIREFDQRFQLDLVSGETNIYDFTRIEGTVTQIGYPINPTNLNYMEDGIFNNAEAIGDLTTLNTVDKTDVVAAINEVLAGIYSNNLASQAEAEAGTDNTKAMTPLRVAQAIAALVSGSPYEVLGVIDLTVDGKVDFQNIPADYEQFKLLFTGRSSNSGAQPFRFGFNNGFSSGYYSHQSGIAGTTTTNSASSDFYLNMLYALNGNNDSRYTNLEIDIYQKATSGGYWAEAKCTYSDKRNSDFPYPWVFTGNTRNGFSPPINRISTWDNMEAGSVAILLGIPKQN